MQLLPVELPAPGVSLSEIRQPLEFLSVLVRIGFAGELFQVVPEISEISGNLKISGTARVIPILDACHQPFSRYLSVVG